MSLSDPVADTSSTGSGLGPAPNPMLGAVIDALSGTRPIDPLALMRTQLDSYAQDNPQVAQLLHVLEQRRQQPPQSDALQENDMMSSANETPADPELLVDGPRDIDELQDTGNKLYAELESLRRRSAALAAALGACHLCFGGDPLCDECGGRGVPGSRVPKPEAFRRYVLPAIRRARAVESGARPPPHAGNPEQTGKSQQVPGRGREAI